MALKFWVASRVHNLATLDRPARITKMATTDLKAWMDLEVMHLGECFDKWRYHGYGADEITSRLEVLAAMWDELLERPD